MPRTPENGARMILRSIVARISPTRASACLCSAATLSYSACEMIPCFAQAAHRGRVGRDELELRFGRGELRPLLLRVEPHEHVALAHRRGRSRTRSSRRCRADRR